MSLKNSIFLCIHFKTQWSTELNILYIYSVKGRSRQRNWELSPSDIGIYSVLVLKILVLNLAVYAINTNLTGNSSFEHLHF